MRMWRSERVGRAALRQLVAASYASRASLLSLGREDEMVARFAALCDQAATDLVHAESLPAWLAVRLRAGAIVAGLVTLVAHVWTPLSSQAGHASGALANGTNGTNGTLADGVDADSASWAPGQGAGAALGMSALLLCLIAVHLARAATAAVRTRSHLAAAAEARDLVYVSALEGHRLRVDRRRLAFALGSTENREALLSFICELCCLQRAELEDESLSVRNAASCDDPSLNWPSLTDAGGIVLRDVWRPPELRGVSARVALGECCGVLGPPSAVLAAALLRFIRPSAGCILVSGADIADVPLTLLRAAVVVVPARPTVFKGTLRSECHVGAPRLPHSPRPTAHSPDADFFAAGGTWTHTACGVTPSCGRRWTGQGCATWWRPWTASCSRPSTRSAR